MGQGGTQPRLGAQGSFQGEVRAKQVTTEPLSFSAPLFCSPLSNKQTLFFPLFFPEEVVGGEGSMGPCRAGWPGSWNECPGTEVRKEDASEVKVMLILHCREAIGLSVNGGGDFRLGSVPS